MEKIFLCLFVILASLSGSHGKDLFVEKEIKPDIQNTLVNKNPMLFQSKAQPSDSCEGSIEKGCDFKNLLLCLDGKCTCPEMDHDEVMRIVNGIYPITPPEGVEFVLNTTWENEKCVGHEGSFCIANLPPQAEGKVPINTACKSGLSCDPYSEKSLFGRCDASKIFVTFALYIFTLTTMLL